MTLFRLQYFAFFLIFLVKTSYSQGFDAGPEADPLKLGQIDPVILELGATYLYITPFVVFLMGILVIPVTLVFLFLIIIPLYVPTSSTEGGRTFGGMSMTGDCVSRILCEIMKPPNVNEDYYRYLRD